MISIILPTYNCDAFIGTAIKSILLQSFKKYELIIINDGSTDDTKSIIKNINDSRIKYFEKEHSGLGESIDFGIHKSNYDLIARMDADDIAHPDRLKKQYYFISLHKDIDVLSNWYAAFNNSGIRYIVKRSVNHLEILKNFSLYSDVCHPSVLIKKKSIEDLNGFKVEFRYDPFGDYVIWLRLKSRLKFHNIPEVLHYYRTRSDSLSNEALANRRNIIYEIQKPYYENTLTGEFQLSAIEELAARGWREYLYGDVNKSFYYWRKLNIRLIQYPSIIAATAARLLPKKFFQKLYGKRIPDRVKYLMKYFSSFEQSVIKEFRKTLNEIECFH
ncbi:MAG: glycosyltransferase [Melioribacter sp.]|nr:glycosyltransferase [Melioribacter sp.]